MSQTPEDRLRAWYPDKDIELTSKFNPLLNCVAFAAGQRKGWWDDLGSNTWPAERSDRIESLTAVFESLRYVDCNLDDSVEPGFEKVALFALGGKWTHACKQCPDGRWCSKLGIWEDVTHHLRDIEDDEYGQVAVIMKRPIAASD